MLNISWYFFVEVGLEEILEENISCNSFELGFRVGFRVGFLSWIFELDFELNFELDFRVGFSSWISSWIFELGSVKYRLQTSGWSKVLGFLYSYSVVQEQILIHIPLFYLLESNPKPSMWLTLGLKTNE